MRADEDYIEAVLGLVEQIPHGRVTTYGAIADVVGSGPRLVGNVMARHGGGVPWWRVVRSDGSLPPSHHDEARACYLEEGTPLRRSGISVDLAAAFWQPRRAPGRDVVGLLAAYDAQLRGESEVRTASSWDHVGPLWRARFEQRGFVTYESLAGYDLVRLVTATVEHFAHETDVESFEWKTRGHDELPGMHEVLVGAGFIAEEVETVMMGEAALLAAEVPVPAGVAVVDISSDLERLRAAAVLCREVFGRGPGPESVTVHDPTGPQETWAVVTDSGEVVCTGRFEMVLGTDVAGLWGGACHADWRGRGLYRAVTAARARSAMARGVRLLHSDCTAMSRPILERSGLVAVTTTTPYVWTRPASLGIG